jgi:hypothetical protein
MKKCKSCQQEIDDKATKCPHCQTDQRNWFSRHKIITAIIAIFVILVIIGMASNSKSSSTSSNSTNSTSNSTASSSTSQKTTTPTPAPTRKVAGTAVTLGAGTFQGGKDVAVGLYDVTTAGNQSGNFYVSGTDSANEILGVNSMGGVPKIRVKISNGDSIEISGLSQVIFTPVTTPFVTAYQTTTLYAGTFTVGEDIGEGRYVITTTAGKSGNLYVSGKNSVNEILGTNSMGGVPSVTTNLSKGDIIEISSLSQVIFTPTK